MGQVNRDVVYPLDSYKITPSSIIIVAFLLTLLLLPWVAPYIFDKITSCLADYVDCDAIYQHIMIPSILNTIIIIGPYPHLSAWYKVNHLKSVWESSWSGKIILISQIDFNTDKSFFVLKFYSNFYSWEHCIENCGIEPRAI